MIFNFLNLVRKIFNFITFLLKCYKYLIYILILDMLTNIVFFINMGIYYVLTDIFFNILTFIININLLDLVFYFILVAYYIYYIILKYAYDIIYVSSYRIIHFFIMNCHMFIYIITFFNIFNVKYYKYLLYLQLICIFVITYTYSTLKIFAEKIHFFITSLFNEINSVYGIFADIIKKNEVFYDVVNIITIIIVILISIAYITLAERKILGLLQRRVGPNIIGIIGLLQPISDGVKLIIKEIIIPKQANFMLFILGPISILLLCFLIWIPIPFILGNQLLDLEYSVFYTLIISSLSVYVFLFSGWSSNSRYSFIGLLRSVSQLISYEISFGLIIMGVIKLNNSFNFNEIILNQIYIPNIIPLFTLFVLFFITILAETNRVPFDLPEAESELIAGYIIEYGGMSFAAIYLAEYGFINAMCIFTNLLFLGSVNISNIFTLFFIFLFILIRGLLPRIKFDELIKIGWTKILPISINYLIIIMSIEYIFY